MKIILLPHKVLTLLIGTILTFSLMGSLTYALDNTSLISYWSFDTLYNDSIGTNNLSNSGGSLITGKIGQGVNISNYAGTTNYLTKASPVNMPLSNWPRTFTFWIKRNSNQTSHHDVLGYGNYANDQRSEIYLFNGKISYYVYGAGDYVSNLSIYDTTTWHFVAVVYNGSTNLDIYLDNVKNTTPYRSLATALGTNPFNIGKGAGENNYGNFSIDEVSLWNRSLTSSEINELWNNGNGFNPLNVSPPVIPSYTVSNIQTPSDVNSSYAGTVIINTSIGGDSRPSASDVNLSLKIVTVLSNCAIFYKTTCNLLNNTYKNYSMSKINDSYFSKTLYDTDYYPAYYPYDYSVIDSSIHSNYTVYLNNYIKWNIFNLSTDTSQYFITIETDAWNLSDNVMLIYYCNNTYSSGNPVTNNNCELVQSFLPINIVAHYHNQSRHYSLPITINIGKTKNSSIIFMSSGNVNNGWKFEYITNSNYDNESFMTGNYNSWTRSPNIFDIHLHAFKGQDYFRYYTSYHDNSTGFNISSETTDFYNITNYAPSGIDFYSPCDNITLNTTGRIINFNWSPSYDVNNDSFTYKLYVSDHSSLTLINDSIPSTFTSYNYTITSSFGDDTYHAYMKVCDTFNNCVESPASCDFTTCTNLWEYALTPCIGGVRQINYIDSASCSEQFEYPTTNSSFINCTLVENVTHELNQNIYIHIWFWVTISLVFAYAWHTRNKYMKLSYAFVSILLYYYNFYIQEILFTNKTGVYILVSDIMQYSFWLASLYFLFIGVYWIFKE